MVASLGQKLCSDESLQVFYFLFLSVIHLDNSLHIINEPNLLVYCLPDLTRITREKITNVNLPVHMQSVGIVFKRHKICIYTRVVGAAWPPTLWFSRSYFNRGAYTLCAFPAQCSICLNARTYARHTTKVQRTDQIVLYNVVHAKRLVRCTYTSVQFSDRALLQFFYNTVVAHGETVDFRRQASECTHACRNYYNIINKPTFVYVRKSELNDCRRFTV